MSGSGDEEGFGGFLGDGEEQGIRAEGRKQKAEARRQKLEGQKTEAGIAFEGWKLEGYKVKAKPMVFR